MIILYYTGPVYNTNNGYVITTIGKHARRFKKPEVGKYQKEFEALGKSVINYFQSFNEKYDFIEMNVYWYNPKFFTSKNTLSKTSGDTDGIIKFIKDGIANGIGVNDAFFKKESIIQLPSSDEHHHICIELSIQSIHGLISGHKFAYESKTP